MVLASAAIGWAAALAARRLRRAGDPALEHVLTALLLFGVGILAVSLLVGLVGLYRPLPLTLASVALAAAARAAFGGVRRAPLEVGAALRRLAAAAAGAPLAAVAVGLAAAAVLNRAAIALLVRPGGFDALAYHLVFVGDWVQRGAIGGSDLQRAGCCAWYPASAELTYAWLAVFPHSDRLVGLAQVAYLVVGALATAAGARSVGAAGRYAAVAGALFVLTPAALRQAHLANVDVALAAAVLLVVAFALRLLRDDAAAADVVRFGLAAGFAVGVKATAVPYVAAAALVVVAAAVVRRRRAGGTSGLALVRAAALVAVLVVLGGAWYVRAWTATGNPLWPYRVAALGVVVFDGPRDPEAANPTAPPLAGLPAALHAPRSWLADLDLEAQLQTDPDRPDARLGGLGLVWLLLGLPATLASLVLALRRRDLRFPAVAFMVAVPALLATPDSWWARFTIPLSALGAIAVALVATRLPAAGARALVAVALVLAAVGAVTARPLAPLAELRSTPGVPIDRPPPRQDGLDYGALDALPDRARVGVLPGSPLLPYLVLGERFGREVVPVRDARTRPGALARAVEDEGLDHVVSRVPLPAALVRAAGLSPAAVSSGAVVYRVGPGRTAPGGPAAGG